MKIQVTGRHVEIGSALSTYIEDRLNAMADKYFSKSIDAAVTIDKQGKQYSVDCSFHANQGVTLQSSGMSEDVYDAFEMTAGKIEKQLRRYKRRITNHHKAPLKEIEPTD